MRVLALEPFYGGSHKAFLDGWQQHSRHEFTILGLPAYKWKWRMRHAAMTFSSQLNDALYREQSWDAVWCSDMLNFPEFAGLAPQRVRELPRVAFFHENQLTYPVRSENERDLHFAFTNFVTAAAADQVWFNSDYHRNDFLAAMRGYLSRMPDFNSIRVLAEIETKSTVQYPGIDPFPTRDARGAGPLRICWNARWEHDKNPEDFFAALRILKSENVDFRLIVLGESFRNSPEVFHTASDVFAEEIEHWGYAPTMEDYRQWLSSADVVVSTANHEFFGLGIVEGIAAGAWPLVPNRLAYPEVISHLGYSQSAGEIIFDGSMENLARHLRILAAAVGSAETREKSVALQHASTVFHWSSRASQMDDDLEQLANQN